MPGSRLGWCVPVLTAVMTAVLATGVAFAAPGPPPPANPEALWQLVHGRCVPDQQRTGDPAPCALVRSDGPDVGTTGGYAVLKDLVGAAQYLVLPTERIDGIESPALLAPGATDYFAAAWRARSFVAEKAGVPLDRDDIALAVNSASARTQNQLHVHVDCVRADVRDALRRHADDLGGTEMGRTWAPFPEPLAGHDYLFAAVPGDDLAAVNPVRLLADGVPGARADMGAWTLAAVGVTAPDGRPGFALLAQRADPAAGAPGAAEELQDHLHCPPPE